MLDINTLRSNRNSDFSKINKAFDEESNGNSYEDNRFWKPERDKAGNALAVIRFLPKLPQDELPWVKVFSHGFKGPTGRWYIEDSLTTIGQPDPVSKLNSSLWNSTTDDNSPARKQAREQKRRLQYISNILVIDDKKHPENNGKIFLIKYGKKIHDKILDKAKPTFEDEAPVNVFDYWEGANFNLRVKMVAGFPNYDSSSFDSSTPIASSDEKILEIANQQYELKEFIDPKNFKSYEELEKKLKLVLNDENDFVSASEMVDEQVKETPVIRSTAPKMDSSDDDDVLNYFQQLANE